MLNNYRYAYKLERNKKQSNTFSKKWEYTTREEADAKEFLLEFLNIFGVERKKVATFEQKVKKLSEASDILICFGRVCCWLNEKPR